MITLDFEKPTEFDLIGDMPLILAWMRSGYPLHTRKLCKTLQAWSDAPSRQAIDLNPADVARLLTRGLIEEDLSRQTDTTSTYRLTAAGWGAGE